MVGRVGRGYRKVGRVERVYRRVGRVGRVGRVYSMVGRVGRVYRKVGRVERVYRRVGRVGRVYEDEYGYPQETSHREEYCKNISSTISFLQCIHTTHYTLTHPHTLTQYTYTLLHCT